MTNDSENVAQTPQPDGLSDAELRATLYFAVGVTSESGYAAYKLAVAGDRASTPTLEPADNSGYTIGTLQTDLGQHYQPNVAGGENLPRDLVDAYQSWSRTAHPDWVLTDAQAQQAISDLGRNGGAIRADQGRPVDATVKSRIDSFLATEDGINWVHARDVAQVDKLMGRVIAPLQRSELYREAPTDDQVRLAVIVAKAFNQNEVRSSGLIEAIESNRYDTVAEVSMAVDNLSPKRRGDYFEQGRDKALLGADVVNSLRNAGPENPLSSTWQNVLSNPLINPNLLSQAATQPNLASEYPTVKGLFLHYDRAEQFNESLERGGTYQNAPVDRGNASKFNGAGFYVSGNDFVTWNQNGEGHAYIGGTWSEVARNDLSRTRNPDQTTDLYVNRGGTTERLLHVDPDAPALRPADQPTDPKQTPAPTFPPGLAPTNGQDWGPFAPSLSPAFAPVMAPRGPGAAEGVENDERRRAIDADRPPSNSIDPTNPSGAPSPLSIPPPIPSPDERENGQQDTHTSIGGPFNSPNLDHYYAAVMGGDSDLADKLANEFARSPEGQRMSQQGDQLLAQQQTVERHQAREQQLAPTPTHQGPVMRI